MFWDIGEQYIQPFPPSLIMPRHLTVVQLLDGKLALAGTGNAFMARAKVNKDTLILKSVTLKYDAPPFSSGLMLGSD